MTVVAKGRKPMTDDEYAGWREALTRLDDAVVLTEHAKHAAPKTEQAFIRGKLTAYLKARDSVLAVVRREQERRETPPDALSGPQSAETGAKRGLGHVDGQDDRTDGEGA